MHYKGLPEQQLKKINPLRLQRYLDAGGWEQVHKENAFAVYRRPHSFAYEIIVLYEPEYMDYPSRMAESLCELARFENRSALHILRELLLDSTDVLRFKINTPGTTNGTIPMPYGLDVYNKAKKILQAAARSVLDPHQAAFAKLNHPIVNEFIETCRLGQTEEGSFVTTFICPLHFNPKITKESSQLSLPSILTSVSTQSFSRRVTVLLMQSLSHVLHMIRMGCLPESIADMQQERKFVINANLLEALNELEPLEESAQMSLECDFSFKEPVDMSTPREICFEKEDFFSLAEIVRVLRPTSEPSKFRFFVGTIDVLRGNQIDERGRKHGEVILNFQDEEEVLKAKLDLGVDDYASAIKAHEYSSFVRLQGTLQRAKRIHIIEDIGSFEIITPALELDSKS